MKQINKFRVKAAHNIRDKHNQPAVLTTKDVEDAFGLFLDFLEWYYPKYESVSREELYMEIPRKPITIMDKVDEIHTSVVAEIEKLKVEMKQDRLLKPNWSLNRNFEIGDEIAERYMVEEMVGTTKNSEMYRVTDRIHPIKEEKFALEVLHGDSEYNRKIYTNEIKIRSKVKSDYIGRFIFADQVSSNDFVLILEYIDGKILSNWKKIHVNHLEWADFGKIVRQILTGLDDLHKLGFVHGDIQPKNIVIETNSNKVKIVNFGSSGKKGESVDGQDGNKAYQPPDLKMHGKHPGQDTYAVGLILYEFICGGNPFALPAENAYEEIQKTAELGELKIGMKPAVREIISKACRPALGKRYENAGSMLKAMKDAQLIK